MKIIKESTEWSRFHIVRKDTGETIDSYTDRKDAEDWIKYLVSEGDFTKDALEIVDSHEENLKEFTQIKVGNLVTHIDDADKTRGVVTDIKGSTATVSVGPSGEDIIEVPLSKLQLDESKSQRRSVHMIKKISESLRNFTIVSNYDEEGAAVTAESAVEAIQEFREVCGDNWIISEVYDELGTYYNPETGDEVVEESLTEDTPKDWEVKQISMDVAVPAGTDLYCQGMSGNTALYKGLCKLFDSLGYEMAGDIVDSNDMTDVYKSNGYEFFTESD